MPTARAAPLYSPELLALATGLADYPLNAELPYLIEARSRTCGSTIMLGVSVSDGARVQRIGMQVSACAIGQASAMVLAQSAQGQRASDIIATAAAIEEWLAGAGPLPDWPGIAVLGPALPHAGRHGALLLPWTAVRNALSSAATGG